MELMRDKNLLPITDHIDNFIEKSMGNICAENLSTNLVSFFTKKPHSRKFESIGSGFILLLGDELYIATAYHVLEQIKKDRERQYFVYFQALSDNNIFKFEETIIIDNGHIKAEVDKEGDCVFLPVNNELKDKLRKTQNSIDYFYPKQLIDKEYIETSTFMIMGFPSNRNQFSPDNSPSFSMVNIIFHDATIIQNKNIIHFVAEKKNNTVEKGSSYTPNIRDFNPLGMSGSPVFQIYTTKSLEIKPFVIGIFVRFKKNNLTFISTILETDRYK